MYSKNCNENIGALIVTAIATSIARARLGTSVYL